MTDTKKLSAAINAIGVFFTDLYEHTDNQTGVVSERNRLGFIQDKVLNGICYQLASTLDWTVQRTLPDAQQAVKRAIRQHKGDEISEQHLERALDWVSRIEDQMVLVEAALATAKAQYEKHTGKDFTFGRKPIVNEGVELSPALQRAKAMGLTGQVADDHNSNKAA